MRTQSPRLIPDLLDSHLQGGVRESGSQTTSLVVLNVRKDSGNLIESPITPSLVKERKEKPNEIGSHRELMVQLELVPKSPLLCLAKLSQEKFFLGGKWLQTT